MDLDSMKYADLRNLAKTVGIKGNMKADKLLKALKQYYQQQQQQPEHGEDEGSSGAVVDAVAEDGNSATQHVEPEKSATPRTQLFVTERRGKGKRTAQASQPSEAKKDGVVVSAKRRRLSPVVDSEKPVDITSEQPTDAKQENTAAQENEPKVRKAGKIPRHEGLMKRTKLKPITPNFKKLHEAHFNKMESIDSYVERKIKQMEGYKSSAQLKVRPEKTLPKPADGGKIQAKVNLNRASMFSPASVDKKPAPEKRRHTQASASKPAPKAAVPFRPSVVSTRRINVRFSAATEDNEHKMSLVKTPARRSTGTALSTPGKQANDAAKASAVKSSFASATKTPGVFVFNANTSVNTPGTNKKPTFDLKASLSRPLGYKPHKGKLKPFAETKENTAANKSVQTSVLSASHQKNYKQHKVQTREERRAQHRDDRRQKKESMVGARRGLVMA